MADAIETGGPAFPQSETLYEDGAELARTSHGGMTLRDWFAGQALAGLCHPGWEADPVKTPDVAYAVADAMIAARTKAGGKS